MRAEICGVCVCVCVCVRECVSVCLCVSLVCVFVKERVSVKERERLNKLYCSEVKKLIKEKQESVK